MAELSTLADSTEATFDLLLGIVSGGNSGNLQWALNSSDMGRINDLRLGESLLLGLEPLHRQPIEGLFTDAITFVAEVIELKTKPSLPQGVIAQSAFGETAPAIDRGHFQQAILAIGRQDIDPEGLYPPTGLKVLHASSDHLILDAGSCQLQAGTEIAFGLNYSAMVRAMTSPFVSKVMTPECGEPLHRPGINESAAMTGAVSVEIIAQPASMERRIMTHLE